MSIVFGLVLLVLTGWLVLKKLDVSTSSLELTPYAVLTGIGIQSIWMFMCDLFQIQFSQSLLTVFNLGLIVILADFDALKKFDWIQSFNRIVASLKAQMQQPNLGVWVIIAVIAGLIYLIAMKGLYWPTSEHDAIGTFDKLGMWFALEGKIHVSLYDVGLQGAGGVYPPLFPASIAYCYLYGAENPKVISLMFYIATLMIFFSALKRYTTVFGAALFTLILAWSPEFYSHAALLLSNLPSAAYIAGASISMFVWFKERDYSYFILSSVMIAFALWLRQDLLPFAVAGFSVVVYVSYKEKNWKLLPVYFVSMALPFLIWSYYAQQVLHLSAAGRLGAFHLISFEKLKTVSEYLWAYLGVGQYGGSPPGYFLYGIAFILPAVFVLLNIKTIAKDWLVVVFYGVFSLAVYTLIFLLIDEQQQRAPLSSLMESSFKRGLFCFIPVALFYAGTSSFSIRLFTKLEAYRNGVDEHIQ